jgi:hypothetical protein
MRRTFAVIAALAALAFAGAASAADPVGPFKLDAKGKCHAANGQFAKQTFCKTPAAAPAPKHCKDPKTKRFVKCGTPGAVPA